MIMCTKHTDRVAVLAPDWEPGYPPSTGLCATCAQCSEPGCITLPAVLDSEYDEPWCLRHADQFSGDETVSGPALRPTGIQA